MSILDYPSGSGPLCNYQEKKKWIIGGSIALVVIVLIIIISVVATNNSSHMEMKGSYVLTEVPLVDGHNDLPYRLRKLVENNLTRYNFDSNLMNDTVWGLKNSKCENGCHTDLHRLREGGVGAQFWVAYANCTTQYKDAVGVTLEQIDVIKRLISKYPNDLQLVTTAEGIWDAFNNKKIASLIGIEGGHSIDSRIGLLRTYYDLGVRYMTLTHTCNTPWATAAGKEDPENKLPSLQLKPFGERIVQEMNRIGMMVDLSHVSFGVMKEAIKVSKAPVIFSHSSAYGVNKHPRNVPDDILKLLKNNTGIVMVNFFPTFLSSNSTANVDTVIEHIEYIVNKTGFDHVGIGADYDGVELTPTGLEDVSKYPVLFNKLYEKNKSRWTPENLKKLAGENFIRVFKDVEKVRDNLANQIQPEQKWIDTKLLTIANHFANGTIKACRADQSLP